MDVVKRRSPRGHRGDCGALVPAVRLADGGNIRIVDASSKAEGKGKKKGKGERDGKSERKDKGAGKDGPSGKVISPLFFHLREIFTLYIVI